MIRIFKLVLLLVVSQVAFGQAPSNYTNINGRYRWIAGMFDSTFHIPKGTSASLRTGGSTNAGALFYNTTDSSVYTYTGTQWIKLRGVVIDTTSLSNRINLKLNISDTASMLNPYLRKIDTTNKFITQVYKKNGSDSVFYVKGGNHLWAFNDSTGSAGGGGGGKIYYFNGGVSMGTIGGLQMYELGDTANTGTAANFTRATTGNIANFITDPNKPGLLQIPAGVWSVDAWLSETGGGSNHAEIWVEVEKWDGSTITTIATSPIEQITEGSTPNLYSWSVSIPTTSLTVTDRIIIQFYISNTNGKTVTLYTQNGYVGEVHTTFTTGIGAINGLTTPAQYLVTGTSGTDFNISSVTATHTFNLPTASATNRGALSSADWTTFNSKLSPADTVSLSNRINLKLNISDTAAMLSPYARTNVVNAGLATKVNISDTATMLSPYARKNFLNAGTGISYSSTTGTIANTAPDQTVALSAGTGISISGTYPNFTITNSSPSSGGTVTSVGSNTGTGLTGGPITTSGTLAIDTLLISTRAWRKKGIDSVQANLTAGLATKLNISDTASMLSPYARTNVVNAGLALKVNISDTASMLTPYLRKIDTTSMLSPYLRSNVADATYVPQTRTITINGTSQDLTANRTYNVGTVTSVGATAGTGISVSGSPITSSGSFTITNTAPDQTVVLNNGTGISVSGTYPTFTITNTSPSSGGTVTSVGSGTGLSGGPITTSGTLSVDTLLMSTRAWRQKGIDSVQGNLTTGLAGKVNISDTASMLTPYLRKIDTTAMLTPYLRANVAAATYAPQSRTITINGTSQDLSANRTFNVGTVTSVGITAGTGISVANSPVTGSGNITVTNTAPDQTVSLSAGTGISIAGTYPSFTITNSSPSSGGTVTSVGSGTGLTGGPITSSGTLAVDTLLISTRLWRQKGVDSVAALANTKVSSVSGTAPISSSGGTSPTISISQASGSTNGFLSSTDWTTFNNKQNALTNPVTGTGTTNYIPKFTSSSAIGNSQIFDNGTSVGIGVSTINVESKLSVAGGAIIVSGNTGTDRQVMELTTSSGVALLKASYVGSSSFGDLAFSTGGSERMRLDASGNLGLGVTPSAWSGSYKTIQNFAAGISSQPGSEAYYTANAYFDAGWKYIYSNFASRYEQVNSIHSWYTAPSGTAGNAITFTQAMTLDASGRLGIGTTSPGTSKLYVLGDATNYGITSEAPSGYGKLILKQTSGQAWSIGLSSNDLFFYYGGTSAGTRVTFANGGNVGIGTTNPSYLLDVNGQARFLGNGSTNSAAIFNNPSGAAAQFYAEFNAGATVIGRILRGNGAAGLVANGLNIDNYDGFQVRVNQLGGSGGTINLMGGNVGIGTTSPAYKLHIVNTGNTLIQLNGNNTSTALDNGFTISADDSKNIYLYQRENAATIFGTANSERMRITSGGNVGINTQTPSAWNGAAGVIVSQYSASGNSIYSVQSNSTTIDQGGIFEGFSNAVTSGSKALGSIAFLRENTSTTALSSYTGFYTNNAGTVAERMRITSGGNVGIGTQTPDANSKLDVNGQAFVARLALYNDNGTPSLGTSPLLYSPASGTLAISTASSERMRITTGGSVGIGTTTIGSTLQVNGNAAIGYSASTAAPTNGLSISGNTTIGTTTAAGKFTIDPDDNQVGLAITGTSLTGSNAQSLIDLAQTWNTTGNPTAIKLNITNTASGASANLMDLQVGGTSQFQVTKGGAIQTAGGVPWKLTGSVVEIGGSNLTGITVEVDGVTYYLVTGYPPEPEPDPSAAPSGPSGNYKTYNKPTPTRSVQDAKIAALEKELTELKEMLKSLKK